MITTCATFSLFGPAGAGWLSCGVSEQVGLLERRGLTKVAQDLKAPDVPRQGVLADATPPSPLRLAQGAQARRALRVDVTTRVCLLRLLPARRPGALHRALAAGRGGGALSFCVPGPVGGLLARLDRASSGRGEDDGPRATTPRHQRGPVVGIRAAPGRPLRAPPPGAAPHRLLAAPLGWSLGAGGVREGSRCHRACQGARPRRGHGRLAPPPAPPLAGPERPPPLPGQAPRRTGEAYRKVARSPEVRGRGFWGHQVAGRVLQVRVQPWPLERGHPGREWDGPHGSTSCRWHRGPWRRRAFPRQGWLEAGQGAALQRGGIWESIVRRQHLLRHESGSAQRWRCSPLGQALTFLQTARN